MATTGEMMATRECSQEWPAEVMESRDHLPLVERISVALNHNWGRRRACPGDPEREGAEQQQSGWPGKARPRADLLASLAFGI